MASRRAATARRAASTAAHRGTSPSATASSARTWIAGSFARSALDTSSRYHATNSAPRCAVRYDPRVGFYCPQCGHNADAAGACPRDGAVLARVSEHDLLGRKIGDYIVLANLGGGAFGQVYRAIQPRSGATVAIKLLRQPLSEPRPRSAHEQRRAETIDDA